MKRRTKQRLSRASAMGVSVHKTERLYKHTNTAASLYNTYQQTSQSNLKGVVIVRYIGSNVKNSQIGSETGTIFTWIWPNSSLNGFLKVNLWLNFDKKSKISEVLLYTIPGRDPWPTIELTGLNLMILEWDADTTSTAVCVHWDSV